MGFGYGVEVGEEPGAEALVGWVKVSCAFGWVGVECFLLLFG